MAKPLLTEDDLAPLIPESDLDPPGKVPPKGAVDKKTGLPLVSPQLAAKSTQLTDEERSDKNRHAFGQGNVSDVGFAQFVKEVISGRDPGTKAIASGDRAAIEAEGERVLPAVGGAGAAGKAAKAAIGYAAPKAGLNAFAESSAKAIANAAKNKIREAVTSGLDKIWGIGPLLALGTNAAIDAAPGAGAALAKGAKAAAPVAGPGARSAVVSRTTPGEEPKPFRGQWSNAVERLRASAPGNPRAQELLSRIDAPPVDTGAGTGTVTQSE